MLYAPVKLTWKRERNDEGNYYWVLSMAIGKRSEWVAEVSSDFRVWLTFTEGGWAAYHAKTMDKAKAYAEKRVMSYFGLKEN